MRQVISLRDLEEMVRSGKDARALPEDALLTPSARDFLRELEANGRYEAPESKTAKPSGPARPVTSKSSSSEIAALLSGTRR